jgi:pyruvate/2-oxoglutarate dehydrogenase complex dihydrolipoamide acyltransferase (E2) component
MLLSKRSVHNIHKYIINVNSLKRFNTMRVKFVVPKDISSIHECDVIECSVTEGQQINKGDLIMKLETAKAVLEETAPVAGIIRELCVKPGDKNIQKSTVLYKIDY